MAKKKLIEINKGKCIAALLHVLIELKKTSRSKWGFLIKLNLVKRCILNFEKLAIFAGLSVGQLLIGTELSADNNKLGSTVFADFDNDGDIDSTEIYSGSGSIIFHEAERDWDNEKHEYKITFQKELLPFTNLDPDLVGFFSETTTEVRYNPQYDPFWGYYYIPFTLHHTATKPFLLRKQSGEFVTLSENGSEGFIVENSGNLNTKINEAVLEDFDNDGNDDLVFSSSNGTIGWAKNNGTEGFNLQSNLITDLDSDVSSLDLIDYDDDGDIDIKLSQGGLAQLYKNNGSEGFVPDPNYNSTDDYHFHKADINNDSREESLTISKSGLVQVSKSQGTDGFSIQTSDLQTQVGISTLHDLDDDGDLDLVYATPNGLAWAKNQGSDAFIPQSTIHETDSAIESFESPMPTTMETKIFISQNPTK